MRDLKAGQIFYKAVYGAPHGSHDSKFYGSRRYGHEGVFIVKLKALTDSATPTYDGKYRVGAAKVLSITPKKGSRKHPNKKYTYWACYNSMFTYAVGKTVKVPNFNPNDGPGCYPGIHGFLSAAKAKTWL